jgi:hypothetical protein
MRPVVIRRAAVGDEGYPVRRFDDLADAVRDCDAAVLALPLDEDTRGLFTADVFGAMRNGSFFVHVGRGEVVDEVALGDALRSGHLGGAGLEVVSSEPLPADDPVWDLPNVIVTPHSSGRSFSLGSFDGRCACSFRCRRAPPTVLASVPTTSCSRTCAGGSTAWGRPTSSRPDECSRLVVRVLRRWR